MPRVPRSWDALSGTFASGAVPVEGRKTHVVIINGDTVPHVFILAPRQGGVNLQVPVSVTIPPVALSSFPTESFGDIAIDSPTSAVTYFYTNSPPQIASSVGISSSGGSFLIPTFTTTINVSGGGTFSYSATPPTGRKWTIWNLVGVLAPYSLPASLNITGMSFIISKGAPITGITVVDDQSLISGPGWGKGSLNDTIVQGDSEALIVTPTSFNQVTTNATNTYQVQGIPFPLVVVSGEEIVFEFSLGAATVGPTVVMMILEGVQEPL